MKRIMCLLIVAVLVIVGSVSYAADIIMDSEADVSTEAENSTEADSKIESLPSPVPTAVLTDEGKNLENLNSAEIPQSSSPIEDNTKNENDMQNVESDTEKDGIEAASTSETVEESESIGEISSSPALSISPKNDTIDSLTGAEIPNFETYTLNAEGQTILVIDDDDIVISAHSIKARDINGKPVTEINPKGYVITGTSTQSIINIESGTETTIVMQDAKCKHMYIQANTQIDMKLSGTNSLGKDGLAGSGLIVIGEVEISGLSNDDNLVGSLSTRGGMNAAGIDVGGTMKINSGSITAVGGANAAGINNQGNLIINGGYIRAECGGFSVNNVRGAGIGGNEGKGCGNIWITGGSVSAVASMDKYGTTAAGIGVGQGGYGGNIEISGGNISAIGGWSTNAAGIGGNGTNIKISGGTIRATKGNSTIGQKGIDGVHVQIIGGSVFGGADYPTNGQNGTGDELVPLLLKIEESGLIESLAFFPDYKIEGSDYGTPHSTWTNSSTLERY